MKLKKKIIRLKFRDWLLKYGYKLTYFEPRPMIRFCRQYFGSKPLCGVEIGVWMGDHAKEILTALNMQRLYLIDPYIEYKEPTALEFYTQERLNIAREVAAKRLNGCIWIDRENLNDTLDFVYIDGNHTYNEVLKDIDFALTKIKHGIVGGHDYSTDYPGVIQAVQEKFKHYYFGGHDWWVIVNAGAT